MSYAAEDTFRADFPFPLPTGVSSESLTVDKSFAELLSHILRPFSNQSRVAALEQEFARLLENHAERGWDGYSAAPLNEDAARQAMLLILSLPPAIDPPEVSADPSGGVELEWYKNPRHVFTACITKSGKIFYSGLFGAAKQSGAEYFTREVPNPVLLGIRRAVT